MSLTSFVTPGPVRADDCVPDAFAPLVRNAWYALAESRQLGRELRSLRALGEPLVMYRTEAGEAVVLDDRCAHRRFPLSEGRLVGDRIQCGYHGFTFDPSGRCVWVPTNRTPHFGVRRYPTVEVGPWVWAWMGDAEQADPAMVPYPKLEEGETWHTGTLYKFNPGNYMLLIENLMDLTHLHFLHGAEVSDRSQADTPLTALENIRDGVGWIKETAAANANIFAALAGGDPHKQVRVVSGDLQIGPSLNHGWEHRFVAEGDDDPLYPLKFHIFHAITPQDMNGTHQFYQVFFNRPLVDGVARFCEFSRDIVFEQDAHAIACMQRAIVADQRAGSVEFGTAGDRFGITMRRILRKLQQRELAQPGS